MKRTIAKIKHNLAQEFWYRGWITIEQRIEWQKDYKAQLRKAWPDQ